MGHSGKDGGQRCAFAYPTWLVGLPASVQPTRTERSIPFWPSSSNGSDGVYNHPNGLSYAEDNRTLLKILKF